MMHEFLSTHRQELIELCEKKVACRTSPPSGGGLLNHGIPMFIDQLVKTLQIEKTPTPLKSRKVSGPADGHGPALYEIGAAAAIHGRELLHRGFTIEQVVHDYGDLCQAITELAFQKKMKIEIEEFQTLNRCLDNAIAIAVTEFSYRRDAALSSKYHLVANEQMATFIHGLHGLLNTATLALTAIKGGRVGVTGATGFVLDASLVGLRNLIDSSTTELRATGIAPAHQLFSLADLIAEVAVSGALEAQVKKRQLIVALVAPDLAIDANRDLLFSTIGTLLQSAFKASGPATQVTLSAYAAADRILIDIEDHRDAAPAGAAQGDADKTALDLSTSRGSVEANGGIFNIRDDVAQGHIVSISLPRHSLLSPPPALKVH